MHRTLEQGVTISNEEGSAPGPDGRMRHWAYSQFPVSGDQNTPEGLGVVIIDITELKNTQQELARLNAELEQRVEERTAELRHRPGRTGEERTAGDAGAAYRDGQP